MSKHDIFLSQQLLEEAVFEVILWEIERINIGNPTHSLPKGIIFDGEAVFDDETTVSLVSINDEEIVSQVVFPQHHNRTAKVTFKDEIFEGCPESQYFQRIRKILTERSLEYINNK